MCVGKNAKSSVTDAISTIVPCSKQKIYNESICCCIICTVEIQILFSFNLFITGSQLKLRLYNTFLENKQNLNSCLLTEEDRFTFTCMKIN